MTMDDDDMIRRGDASSIILLGGSPVGMLERLNALPAVSAPVAVRVKALPWRGELSWEWKAAQTSIGEYLVMDCDCGGTSLKLDHREVWHSETKDEDAGKAAAQADYAARIMAAIDAPDVAELVEALDTCVSTLEAANTSAGVDTKTVLEAIATARAALARIGDSK